jgi:major membrane immunogen (membrane-anchored lipoprotein)
MRRLLALVFCAAALLGGCGSDDDDGQAAPAPTGTPTPEQDRGSYGY